MTKFAELRTPITWTLIALLLFVSRLVMPYLEGRSNSWWWIPPMLPADLLPPLLLVVSCIVLLAIWIRSVVRKSSAVAAGLMFFISLLLFSASLMVRPSYFFQVGFCHYAKAVLTGDEWRSISRFAQEHLKPEGRLPGPHKNLWNETEHRALWSDLTGATQIQKLDPSLMIFVHPEETDIMWGGALVGHRGVIIFTRKRGESERGQLSHAMFIAEDIATSVSAD